MQINQSSIFELAKKRHVTHFKTQYGLVITNIYISILFEVAQSKNHEFNMKSYHKR